MKAVTIVQPGGIEGLEVREVATPASPTADRVRVKVRAAALNRADILQRMGRYPAPPGYPPDIPGMEFAGEVDDLTTGGDIVWVHNPVGGRRLFEINDGFELRLR